MRCRGRGSSCSATVAELPDVGGAAAAALRVVLERARVVVLVFKTAAPPVKAFFPFNGDRKVEECFLFDADGDGDGGGDGDGDGNGDGDAGVASFFRE